MLPVLVLGTSPAPCIPSSIEAPCQRRHPLRSPRGRSAARASACPSSAWAAGISACRRPIARPCGWSHAAIDAGITFLDNAWDYNDGLSEERMGQAIADRRDQVFLMTKVCTHGRDAQGRHAAAGRLAAAACAPTTSTSGRSTKWSSTTSRRGTSRAAASSRRSIARAQQGKVRYVGFTGHKSPALHLAMLAHDYPWDACQLPLNCFDASFRSFEQQVLPELDPPRHRADRHEEPRRRRARGEGARWSSPQEALAYALQPAGRDRGQRHRLDARAAAEPRRSRAASGR